MEETHEPATAAPDPRTDPRPQNGNGAGSGNTRGNDYRVDIDGDNRSPVIVGNHNLLVDAQHGSSVTLLMQGQRPKPVRRERTVLLPRRQQDPIGRAAQFAALAEGVRTCGLVQLYGPPGSGTSMLLRHAARRLAPGPDGTLYLNAANREVTDLAQEVFEACYDAAGYAPSDTELRRLMTGLRLVVYVDNAELTREQALALAETAADATFVFAAHRRSLLGEDGKVIELPGLDYPAGMELLVRELGRPLAPDETDTARALWQAAQGRPLHLLRAAGLARFDSADDARLPLPGKVSELLPLLLERLDTPARTVLRLLATLDGTDLAPGHLAAITELPGTERTTEHLAGLGLLIAGDDGYRCAEDTVPAVFRQDPEPFPVERICDHFADWIARATTTADDVARHSAVLERAAALAEATGRPELAVRIARAASPALARSLRFGAWGRLLGRGWSAAQQADDRPAQAYFTHEEGIRNLLTGRRVIAAVLLGQAVQLWKALGDQHGATTALNAQHYTPAADQLLTGSGAVPVDPSAAAGGHAVLPGGHTVLPVDPTASGQAVHGVATTHAAQAPTAASHMAGLAPSPAPPGTSAVLPHTAAGHSAAGTAAHGTTHAAHSAGQAGVHGAGHTAAHGAGQAGVHGATHAAHQTAAHVVTGTSAASGGAGAAGAAGAAATAGAGAATSAVMAKVVLLLVVVVGGYAGRGAIVAFFENQSASSPDSLAGVWSTPAGTAQIRSSGSGFTMQECTTTTTPSAVNITGSGHSYRASFPVHNLAYGDCGPVIGHSTLNLRLSEDYKTLQATPSGTSTEGLRCSVCGTWTRVS
ncbi:ATP-binding protein [Kitasatospora sp. NPDC057542]|uniref:ATP-binding protein n=1 Tax=Kitasatospora sp. NPDC057542 TaxID=3346162 RepID=UPI0036AE08BE